MRHATRPHYRRAAEKDYMLAILCTFTAGSVFGVIMTLVYFQL